MALGFSAICNRLFRKRQLKFQIFQIFVTLKSEKILAKITSPKVNVCGKARF